MASLVWVTTLSAKTDATIVADIVVVSTFLVARIFMGFLPFIEFSNVKNCFQLIGRSV